MSFNWKDKELSFAGSFQSSLSTVHSCGLTSQHRGASRDLPSLISYLTSFLHFLLLTHSPPCPDLHYPLSSDISTSPFSQAMVLPQVEAASTFFWQDVSLNSVALLSLHVLLAFINVGLCSVVVSVCFGTPGSTT